MKGSLLARMMKRALRQGQTGQTIVILAFGFIVLLCFVGIVTDVSLLFVRYTSLRRAVDAAAVAAAGQVRRTLPTTDEIARAGGNLTTASGFAFARNVANMNLAARSFIEVYGLNPSAVVVDTCATLPTDPQLECAATQEPRKLVRVTAQLDSPTVFMRLIGWGTIRLEASAISETAVLDVVMIFDASESMLADTSYSDWERVPQADGSTGTLRNFGMRYLPARPTRGPNSYSVNPAWLVDTKYGNSWISMWYSMLNRTQAELNADPYLTPTAFKWNGSTWVEVTDASDPNHARQECRVRFIPAAESLEDIPYGSGRFDTDDDVLREYSAFLQAKGILGSGVPYGPDGMKYDAFIPAYNFFGCCNDPDGNGSFADLICQPFQEVRRATEDFLNRVDFARGDRVAFVTFDRNAHLIDPDGSGPQLPMITSQDNALDALRRSVGVRAEPTYYHDMNNDGTWDVFITGGAPFRPGTTNSGTPMTYSQTYNVATGAWQAGGFDGTRLGLMTDYPVKDNCYYDNATLPFYYSLFSSPPSWEATALRPYVVGRWPTPLAAMNGAGGDPNLSTWSHLYGGQFATTFMNPNLNDANWDSLMASVFPNVASPNPPNPPQIGRQTTKAKYSYEFRAACGGSNVGAALRMGNNALLDPRTVRAGNSGAVWVMVMLGDGAAASSDPVRRNAADLRRGNPYGDPAQAPTVGGDYGVFGLCPYGTPSNISGLVDDNGTGGQIFRELQPRCSDPSPTSRSFCPNSATGSGNDATIDIGISAECQNKYDVDDFARDWADFISLTDLPRMSPFGTVQGVQASRSALQLPTIFTIGFGLDFRVGDGSCQSNVNDCLGEELLRYIADVGDNNRLDSDYQQDVTFNGGRPDGTVAGTSYGERGPCEMPIGPYSTADLARTGGFFTTDPRGFRALYDYNTSVGESCGNYYNAPGGPELEKVFDEIASRMFTRLTR